VSRSFFKAIDEHLGDHVEVRHRGVPVALESLNAVGTALLANVMERADAPVGTDKADERKGGEP
jgi:hypothetical protein